MWSIFCYQHPEIRALLTNIMKIDLGSLRFKIMLELDVKIFVTLRNELLLKRSYAMTSVAYRANAISLKHIISAMNVSNSNI